MGSNPKPQTKHTPKKNNWNKEIHLNFYKAIQILSKHIYDGKVSQCTTTMQFNLTAHKVESLMHAEFMIRNSFVRMNYLNLSNK